VLDARTAQRLAQLVRRPMQVQKWVSEDRALMVSVTLGVLTVLYGSSGVWLGLEFALPEGWAVGIMAFAVLAPGRLNRWVLWSTLPVFAAEQLWFVLHYRFAQPLFFSGWFVLLIGLELAGRAPGRLCRVLQRLADRAVLQASAEAVSDLEGDLERTGHGWSVASGWFVAGALLLTSPWTLLVSAGDWRSWTFGPTVSMLALLVIAGAVAGGWLGRLASYGLLGRALAKRELPLEVVPGHPDGAGGLKPIGDFYLYQSLTASLPAIFLGIWVLLISLGGANRTLGGLRPYLDQYILLLPLAILFEVLAFVLPMSSIHGIMKRQKENDLLAQADRLSPAIAAAQAHMDTQDSEDWESSKRRLNQLTERYEELDKAPTWPIDQSIRRRFALRNLGFLVPFVGYALGHTSFWQQISTSFKGRG
jgi:hypothetical protein